VSQAPAAALPPMAPPSSPARRPAPRWGIQTGLLQTRQPAFWLYVVVLVLGLLWGLVIQLAALLTSPAGWLLSLVLLLLYAIPVLLVVRWLDVYEREPRSLLIGAFMWGYFVAPFFAGFSNDFWGVVIAKLGGADFASQWSAALTAPIVEETYKYLGIAVLFLIARAEFDDLIDGFVYGAIVGLGFATAEDLMYFMFNFGGSIPAVIDGFYLRVILSGLYGHVTFTGISGIGLAYFVSHRLDRPLSRRLLVAGGLLLLAMTAHFVWNSPWLDSLPPILLTTFKGLPFLIGLLILLWLARKRENQALGEVLASEIGQPGLLTGEMDLLRDWRTRRAAARRVGRAAGPQAARLFSQLQREQVKLALVGTSVYTTDDAGLLQQRAACQALRLRLWQMPGVAEALGLTPDAVAAVMAGAPPPWTRNAQVMTNGGWALATPDWNDRRRIGLPPHLELQVMQERGPWVLVRSRADWLGWTDSRYLEPMPNG
jgi:RsiW-degrading membrane proteinase PrsW (M82 family)